MSDDGASPAAGDAAPSHLRCSRSVSHGAVTVTVAGELDIDTVPQLDEELHRAQAEAGQVVLDLRGLEFIDSSGAQLLLVAARRIRRTGGRLRVMRASAEVEWLLTLLGIDRHLELVAQPPERADPPA